MKNLTDWFDRVYVINCAHRPDRLEETKQHLAETKMADVEKVIFYPAIVGDWTTVPADWRSGNGAWGCVLPQNRVQGQISGASKAQYSGDAVRIITRGGENITLTVNHPVLTKQGFVRAGDLHKGIDLLRYCGRVHTTPTSDNINNQIPLVGEVFNALIGEGHPSYRKCRSDLDFYGDGRFIHGDVDIVDIDGPLLDPAVWTYAKCAKEGKFVRGHTDFKGLLSHLSSRKLAGTHMPSSLFMVGIGVPPRLSDFFNSFKGYFMPAQNTPNTAPTGVSLIRDVSRVIREFFCKVFDCSSLQVFRNDFGFIVGAESFGVSQRSRFFPAADFDPHFLEAGFDDLRTYPESLRNDTQAVPSPILVPNLSKRSRGKFVGSGQFYGFGPASDLDTCFDKYAFDDVDSEIEFYSELLERHPREVFVDEIISVDRFHYSGKVFDFSTTVGHFTVSNQDCKSESGIIVSNCLRSHQRILEDIMHVRDGDGFALKNALIMEDDIIFVDDALQKFNEFIVEVPDDWGQIYLGGQHGGRKLPTASKHVIEGTSINRTHAYAINTSTIQHMYRHISYATDYRGTTKHVDHQLEVAHRRGDWPVYCPKKWIVGQRAGSSNISGKINPTKFW